MRILIADAAISLAPRHWWEDPVIARYLEKYKRPPIVDGSVHQHLLTGIDKNIRMDRPDILHLGLLTILGYTRLIPELEIFFSVGNDLYEIDNTTRLPRSQRRFYGLLENLLIDKTTTGLIRFVGSFNPSLMPEPIVYFSSQGEQNYMEHPVNAVTYIFGGFTRGSFRHNLPEDATVLSLGKQSLELWTSLSLFLSDWYRGYI